VEEGRMRGMVYGGIRREDGGKKKERERERER
jgi:hypothetical protein